MRRRACIPSPFPYEYAVTVLRRATCSNARRISMCLRDRLDICPQGHYNKTKFNIVRFLVPRANARVKGNQVENLSDPVTVSGEKAEKSLRIRVRRLARKPFREPGNLLKNMQTASDEGELQCVMRRFPSVFWRLLSEGRQTPFSCRESSEILP